MMAASYLKSTEFVTFKSKGSHRHPYGTFLLHRMSLEAAPTCNGCGTDNETIRHILCDSSKVAYCRGFFLDHNWLQKANSKSRTESTSLEFMLKLCWLNYIDSLSMAKNM